MYGIWGGPGIITQVLSTFVFYAIIGVMISGAGYIYLQEKKIQTLQESLSKCKMISESFEGKESLLEKNLKILKRNCGRKQKPVVVHGELRLENLFNAEPQ